MTNIRDNYWRLNKDLPICVRCNKCEVSAPHAKYCFSCKELVVKDNQKAYLAKKRGQS